MVGRLLSHYRILEKIGEGGMGVVYRAHDERLDRDVAVKILPAGLLADEEARKRFRKEARALAQLNHPNIASVHDFDTQEGVDFLVMEYIPGMEVGQKLLAGALTEKGILPLGAQLAEGLTAAHEQGVVHRDLKPGNLRLTPDGRLKILDFGLARWLRPLGEDDLTQTVTESGAVVGTLAYMAPEQLRGELVDARTDIYAAGLVLYELATGERPFQETLVPRLTDAVLHRPIVPPAQLNPELSSRLEEIILKCLEKEPENRYQSAKELLVDLRRLTARSSERAITGARRPRRAAARRIRSLAVLPLENLSRDSEQEYFADGMTEALITDLAKLGALKVISRTSAMRYKGSTKSLPQIASELDVDAVVEGSVLRAGDRVRITAQLIHAATDEHLWAESYQREVRDILSLQSDVARAIAEEIRIKLTPQQRARLARVRPVHPEAHDAYLKGRYHLGKWGPEGWQRGLEYLQQAIEKDPTYAPAYAWLAEACAFLAYWGILPAREAYPKAKAAALKALELDDSLADAHCALGVVHWFYDWDPGACEGEFRRALELNPGDSTAHTWHAVFLAVMKENPAEALAEVKRALELDPLSLLVNVHAGWVLFWRGFSTGQYEPAVEQARKTLDLDPNSLPAYYVLGLASGQMGRFEQAIAALEKAINLSRDERSLAFLGVTYALSGETSQARLLLRELYEQSAQEPVQGWSLGMIHGALGETDKAFECLERAYEERDARIFWLRLLPGYDLIRDDPRCQDLLRRLHLLR